MNKVIQGDCLEKLKELEDNSVDSIVTDPPYELGFMGKSWDSTGIANNKEMWAECLRVLKPGGHLLSFSGTRTYHRMASAIEDAGFEVRDMIEWVYGSGFPKSLNIGKAVDKLQGNERAVTHEETKADSTYHTQNVGQEVINTSTYAVTKGNSPWEGWGTALKPAHEPICMARKPIEKTVAENCLKWGTGGINIDESRVEAIDGNTTARKRAEVKDTSTPFGKGYEMGGNGSELGRFPANLIHDNSEEVRECFPDANHKTGSSKGAGFQNSFVGGKADGGIELPRYNDSGNASRFFKSIVYVPKASKSERNKGCEGLNDSIGGGMNGTENQTLLTGSGNIRNNITKNNHPTVKPIALMEYLIKMVTPKGGTVLDPFAGSGSTLVACKQNGFQYIGIEKELEYIKIIEARLKK